MQAHGALTTLTTDVATLQRLVLEQQQMIETLKGQLHQALKRQFGPRQEWVDVDQFTLFAADRDASCVIELAVADREAASGPHMPAPPSMDAPKPRRKAIRILKDLPREVHIVDLPEEEKVCGCCGKPLKHFADESSEHLAYVPAAIKIIETRRKKYACGSCHGQIKRAAPPKCAPLPKAMAGASLLAFLICNSYDLI